MRFLSCHYLVVNRNAHIFVYVSCFLLTIAGIRKIIGDSCAQHRHLRRDMRRDQHDHYEVSDDVLGKIKSALPYFEGNYDPRAYINWELAVDSEFQNHVLSEKQKVMCASSVLIKHASNDWKHLCRHNKIPQSWKDLKRYFRDVYVPMYYADILFNKLQCLKQDTRTVTSYYHDMQACLLRCGLDECEEAKELRFLFGLNKKIQDMLDCQRYTSLSHLLQLACNAESKIEEDMKKQHAMFLSSITNHLQEVHNHEKEERDMKEPPVPLITLKVEAPPLSEEGIKGKLNGGECFVNELHSSTFYAIAEQPLVEPTAGIPLSQVDLLAVLCDKEELCDNASLISMPQLVNEHAISSVSLCADFKHVVHIANEVQERELLSSLNTLGYVQFDDFCELDNLKKKLFAKSDLPCPTTAIFHIFGESDDRGIYLVHRVYICSDLEPPIHVDKTCKLERNVIANQIVSSLPCFDWKKQVVVNGLRKEHHMEKPRTVFREEGEDDVTMATTDATIAHIMDEQEDIKIKSSKCWNPIRPPTTLLTSNGCRICIRPPFSAREYLMESSWSPLSNGSSLIAKFHLIEPQLKQQGAASPIMGLWACNFVWDPGPGGAHVGCAPARWSTTLGTPRSSSHPYLYS